PPIHQVHAARDQVPCAMAMPGPTRLGSLCRGLPRPPRATCPVGGGSAAVMTQCPQCRQGITSRHLVKVPAMSMYGKPLRSRNGKCVKIIDIIS
ncbi:MAG: hypothetical protein IKH25_05955, partial [Muribaculaceae bacterium]|nr:hypothetical protein [Muribaculaceae bacterium]